MKPVDVIADDLGAFDLHEDGTQVPAQSVLKALAAAGYAVVPVEPTEVMLQAVPLLVAGIDRSYTNDDVARGVYKRMVAAAKGEA